MDDRRRAPAASVQHRGRHGQRTRGGGRRRPVGDDARVRGGGACEVVTGLALRPAAAPGRFLAELIAAGGKAGLAERVMGAAQAGWPLAVHLSCRLPSAQTPTAGQPAPPASADHAGACMPRSHPLARQIRAAVTRARGKCRGRPDAATRTCGYSVPVPSGWRRGCDGRKRSGRLARSVDLARATHRIPAGPAARRRGLGQRGPGEAGRRGGRALPPRLGRGGSGREGRGRSRWFRGCLPRSRCRPSP